MRVQQTICSIFILFFSYTAFALPHSSLISLPGSGEIKPQPNDPFQPPEIFSISLDRLIKNVQYDVTCYLYNPNSELVDIRFDINQPLGGGYGLFTLNNIELDNNQGSLTAGDNVVTVPVALNDNGSTIIFKSLDFLYSVNLISCEARPIIRSMQPESHMMYAFNQTGKPLSIELSNGKKRVLPHHPHSYRMISIDKSNSAIYINNH